MTMEKFHAFVKGLDCGKWPLESSMTIENSHKNRNVLPWIVHNYLDKFVILKKYIGTKIFVFY